ncbi:hypothetical protein Tco_0704006 [Tanacetum coccineum]|uniref:Uncharacterized protein n=1 Tax=Tanacetum coccineum TaxID=301880 RepID=A0ABQ4Y1F8_9ASTR
MPNSSPISFVLPILIPNKNELKFSSSSSSSSRSSISSTSSSVSNSLSSAQLHLYFHSVSISSPPCLGSFTSSITLVILSSRVLIHWLRTSFRIIVLAEDDDRIDEVNELWS